jgi:hypothetical protein
VIDRIGLGIGRGAIRGVVVRRGRVIWSGMTAIADGEDLRPAIVRTLREIPRSRWRPRRVVVAVGPSSTQVKHLTSLPPTRNERLLSQAVAANAGRFFLRNGIPLRVTDVRLDLTDAGGVWVGAMETPVVAAIESACRECRIRYDGAVPAVSVVGTALAPVEGERQVTWIDDDVVAALVIDRDCLVRTRRVASNDGPAEDPPAVVAAIADIGGWDLAGAYGAAVVDLRRAPLLRPSTDEARRRRNAVLRRGALGVMVGITALATLFAPGLVAARTQRAASVTLTRLAPRQRQVAETHATLAGVTKVLERTSAFRGDRPAMTRFLSAITEAIPESTAIVMLRVDSVGGNVLALSLKGAEVLSAVRQIAGVSFAQITAPLTRETIEGAEVERVSIRFQFPRRAKPAPARGPRQ